MKHLTTTLKNGHSSHPLLETKTYRVTGLTGTRFDLSSIAIVPEGSEGRQVFQGPMVPGPWGFTTTSPLVIDNYGGTAAERAQAEAIAVGEPFTVEGLPGVWCFRSPDRKRLEGDGAKLAPYAAS
jgi:hypothetical protein